MAFSEKLADRIRAALGGRKDVEEKKMFGGLAFMVDHKMCLTVGPGRMMCRIDPTLHEELVKREGCRTMVMRGREYKGYIQVDEERVRGQEALEFWVALALEYNKEAKASSKK